MFDHISELNFWIKIFCAVICGFIIGLERQTRRKPVDIRTSILICLGTMLFTFLGEQVVEGKEVARVIGQIVTGVGFLGAGVIMTREGAVSGMTSAAEVWLLAGIGCAIGLGLYGIAFVITFVAVLCLIGIQKMEDKIPLLKKPSRKKKI